jgi:hypothetical protein
MIWGTLVWRYSSCGPIESLCIERLESVLWAKKFLRYFHPQISFLQYVEDAYMEGKSNVVVPEHFRGNVYLVYCRMKVY